MTNGITVLINEMKLSDDVLEHIQKQRLKYMNHGEDVYEEYKRIKCDEKLSDSEKQESLRRIDFKEHKRLTDLGYVFSIMDPYITYAESTLNLLSKEGDL